MTTYVPPRQVLAFLENPTEESALAYLAWQKERMAKIARASEILAKLTDRQRAEAAAALAADKTTPAASSGEAPPRDQANPPPPGKPVSGTEELLYFKREGCPHCRHEDEEIAALKAERPSLKVKILVPGEEDAVWKAFGVEVVPTMILLRADGTKTVARGYTPKAALSAGFTPDPQGGKR
ncbi:MAG TPA: thioredoxin family protein [Planctomycetota bacterium]|nr:thioredoxin family protein [Planctomycetota bacterium]